MVDSHQVCHLTHSLLVACSYILARFVLRLSAITATAPQPAPGRYVLCASSCFVGYPHSVGKAVYAVPVGLIVGATTAVAQTMWLILELAVYGVKLQNIV